MKFLNWNRRKVQNLTAWEIWMFVAGRVFMSFGIGVVAMRYYPESIAPFGFPTLAIGLLLLAFASKGMVRPSPPDLNLK